MTFFYGDHLGLFLEINIFSGYFSRKSGDEKEIQFNLQFYK